MIDIKKENPSQGESPLPLPSPPHYPLPLNPMIPLSCTISKLADEPPLELSHELYVVKPPTTSGRVSQHVIHRILCPCVMPMTALWDILWSKIENVSQDATVD